MRDLIEEALRVAVHIERKSQELYAHAAAGMPEGRGKTVMERLAREESKMIEQLTASAPFPLEIPGEPHAHEMDPLHDDACPPQWTLLDLLEVALKDKSASIAQYVAFQKAFREPAVHEVFDFAVGLSRSLLQLIAEEYRQADQRLQSRAVNRRTKRTHIRSTFAKERTPNEHSQLFISLLDSGRRHP
jgi:hypothetical protein